MMHGQKNMKLITVVTISVVCGLCLSTPTDTVSKSYFIFWKNKKNILMRRLWRKVKARCYHLSSGFCKFIQYTLHTNLGKFNNPYTLRNTSRCCHVSDQTISCVKEV